MEFINQYFFSKVGPYNRKEANQCVLKNSYTLHTRPLLLDRQFLRKSASTESYLLYFKVLKLQFELLQIILQRVCYFTK